MPGAPMSDVYGLQRGSTPLIVSVPHSGNVLPEALQARLTPLALAQPDTDWYVDRLYDFVPQLGATLLVARYSRYVIDLNRPPDDAALYPGAARTGSVPDADASKAQRCIGKARDMNCQRPKCSNAASATGSPITMRCAI